MGSTSRYSRALGPSPTEHFAARPSAYHFGPKARGRNCGIWIPTGTIWGLKNRGQSVREQLVARQTAEERARTAEEKTQSETEGQRATEERASVAKVRLAKSEALLHHAKLRPPNDSSHRRIREAGAAQSCLVV